jgi:high-affinity nickel-transport protein
MELILLCLTALVLGLRHGLDFDHIAAMLDMAGTTVTESNAEPKHFRFRELLRTMKLPALYIFGHGLMTVILGVAALMFGAALPDWIDTLMERVVGITLLLLSLYLMFSLVQFVRNGQDLKLKSRWMMVFEWVHRSWHWLVSKLTGRTHTHKHELNWDSKGSFLVGMIHGVGAETGTQVLLFASVTGTGSLFIGLSMLTAFTAGMTISTLAIAACVSAGLTTSTYFKSVVFVLCVLAALFSFVVGLYFTFGVSVMLPSF